MHAGVTSPASRNPIRRRSLFIVVALPLLLGVFVVAWFAVSEYLCARQVAAEIGRLRAAGQPVDDASMAQWFHDHSSQAGTAES